MSELWYTLTEKKWTFSCVLPTILSLGVWESQIRKIGKMCFPEIFVVQNGTAWLENNKKAIEHVRCAFYSWSQSNQVSCGSEWGTWTKNIGWYLANFAKKWCLLYYHCMWARKWLKKLEIEFKKCKTWINMTCRTSEM